MSAETNPFETNTYDIWAEFEAEEQLLAQTFTELQNSLAARGMDSSFRPRQVWSFPTQVGPRKMIGYVTSWPKRGRVEHLVVNIDHGDSIDYSARGVEVRDYWIDFEHNQLAERVTDVPYVTQGWSSEVAKLNPKSGPVIDYHNADCEVTTGMKYHEATPELQFSGGSIHQLQEIMGVMQNMLPDNVVMYHESVTPGHLR